MANSGNRELLLVYSYELFNFLQNSMTIICNGMEFEITSIKADNDWIRVIVNNDASCCAYPAEIQSETPTSVKIDSLIDPQIHNVESLLPNILCEGKKYNLAIKYESSIAGVMQMFYSNNDEVFSEENSIRKDSDENGMINFEFVYHKNMKLRLDFPDNAKIIIKKISICELDIPNLKICDYGYDGTFLKNNKGLFHAYNLGEIPYLWANYDKKKASTNEIVSRLLKSKEEFFIDKEDSITKSDGNYLSLRVRYDGVNSIDMNERSLLKISLGTVLDEKVLYTFTVHEGESEYLIRLSDYYWFCDNLNIIKLFPNSNIEVKEIKILKGD